MDTLPTPLAPVPSDEQIRMHSLLVQLGDFTRIANRIELMWGTLDCRKYLYSLTLEDPSRHQQGFPLATLGSIVSLLQLHDDHYPQFGPIIKSWERSTF